MGDYLGCVKKIAAYKNVTYNPTAGRPSDALFLSPMAKLPKGILASPDMMLHLDTGSEEHTARRQLVADGLPSLAFDHVGPPLITPPGVKPSDAALFGFSNEFLLGLPVPVL